MRFLIATCIVIAAAGTSTAQVERYELGLRLRAFEKDWDNTPAADARKRAIAPLQQAMKSFFSFNFSSAAKALDSARRSLDSADNVPFPVRWADALSIQPATRFFDREQPELVVNIKPFYKVEGDVPAKTVLRLTWGNAKPIDVPLSQSTASATLKEIPANGDHILGVEVLIDGKPVVTRSVGVSVVELRDERLKLLKKAADAIDMPTTVEQHSLKSLTALLSNLADKSIYETDYPAARLLAEAEALLAAIRKETPYYTRNRAGQFWLTLPTDKTTTPVRLFVPEKLIKGKPVPLLIALHGMGGSENLFFDGYGDGITRKLCEKHGWLMVSPRVGGALGFGSTPPVGAVIDALSERYPVDPKRIYIVGHSMGAAHTAQVVQQIGDRLAGAAMLGGGGLMKKPEAAANVPIYIGCGKADFALTGATALNAALEKAKHAKLRLKVYDDIEHLTIVREAIEDVFLFWK